MADLLGSLAWHDWRSGDDSDHDSQVKYSLQSPWVDGFWIEEASMLFHWQPECMKCVLTAVAVLGIVV